MSSKVYYVEEQKLDHVWLVLERPGGDVVVTEPTQAAAVAWVEKHHPHAEIHVERVENVGPGPDKWRKWK